jgi:hypothetical protein
VPVHKAPQGAARLGPSAVAGVRSPLELLGQDRFRRTLGALRRDALQGEPESLIFNDAGLPAFADAARAVAWELPLFDAADESLAEASPDPGDDAPPDDSDDSRGDSSGEPPAHEAAPNNPEPAPAPGFAGLRRRAGVDSGDERRQPNKAVEGVAAVGAAEGVPAWLADTARQIERLCVRADPAFQAWSVTVPMDPSMLPDTELALSLSHFSLTLRFRTRSEHSAVLISKHRSQLQAMLEKLPALPQSIDIDLE